MWAVIREERFISENAKDSEQIVLQFMNSANSVE